MSRPLTLLTAFSSLSVLSLYVSVAMADEPGGSDISATVDGQAALQALIEESDGNVRIKPGEYRLTRALVVDLDKQGFTSIHGAGLARLIMAGPGPAVKLIGTHGGTADPPSVEPKVWKNQRMPLIDGIEIIGQHPEAVGIELAGTMQAIISRVNVRRCRHGVHLTGRNRNTIITNCHLYENRGVGLYLDDVNLHQINVTGCHISYNGGGGIAVRAGNVRNLHVAGCDLEANMAKDGPASANVLIDSSDGASGCAEVAITGCTIQHTGNAPGSANVRFIGTDRNGRRWGHVTISGNVLSEVHVNIDVAKAQNVILSANTMWTGYDRDIRVVDSVDVAIGPNMLGRNPNYRDEDKADGGVLLRRCEDVTINGVHIKGTRRVAAGLVLEDCRRVNITGCTIRDSQNAGVLLKDSRDCHLGQCMINRPHDAKGPWKPILEIGGARNHIEQ